MKSVRYAGLALVGLWVATSNPSANAGDLDLGRAIAEEYCVQCHDISPDGPFKMDPPSFAAIATFRSEQQIRSRIEDPVHHDMPRYSEYMIGGNISDMVAYIVSLED